MSTGSIERTALAGGDGDDQPYIEQGIEAIEDVLKLELAVGPGEFVIEPVVFAPNALGAVQRSHRSHIGIHTGRLVFHGRNPMRYSPRLAKIRDS